MSPSPAPPGYRPALAAGTLVALVLVVAPNFDVLPGLGYFDSKRLLQAGLFGALTILLVASLPLREKWLNRFLSLPAPAAWALGLVLAGGVISALLGDTTGARLAYALAEVALFAGVLGLAFLVAAVFGLHRSHANAAALGVISVAAGLYVFRFLSRYAVALSLDEPVFVDALIANFSHLRFFGQWISWTLPLIVITPMLLPGRRLRYLPFAIASIWWTLLFLSGTRSTIGAMVIALVVVPLLLGRPGLRWLWLQAISGVVGLALYVVGFGLIDASHSKTGIGRLVESTPFGRLNMWRDAWEMLRDSLFFGAGPQSYAFHAEHLASHPHNSIIQWASEWGIPSLLVVLALALAGFVAWVRFVRREYAARSDVEAVVAAGLTGSVLTAGAHSMLSGIIVMPLSQLYLGLVTGWMLFLFRPRRSYGGRRRLHQHVALTLSATLVCLSLLHVTLRDVSRLGELNDRFRTEELGVLHPRYWQNGRIPALPD